ncbi:hypothetical protein GN958_ATG14726 [Phytophthora infestans]|uniref:Uncharacterized protein n=1 Tax=Phytophthora infestans TaxID=4787 RepID=A0A8S9U956_PHYIN|nr:hypothetical protein GN958_ATG14726 [Phytophthora infestans]
MASDSDPARKASSVAAASADPTATKVSSKWAVTIDLTTLKRPLRPPTSENYNKWSLDQHKLECTARKLNVIKNTKKDDRAMILDAWDANRGGVEALLLRQRKQAKGGGGEKDKHTNGCMFRLLNVLFSDRFFEEFIATGNQLSRKQIEKGAPRFGQTLQRHLETTLRMWKEVSGSFASAEAKSKVSGQGSYDFWDFCGGRADVYYLDRWGHHRGDGWQPSKQTVNRKRRKSSQSSDILERVALLDAETTGVAAVQEGTWNEQKLLIQEQRVAQKLTTLYAMLERNNTVTQQLLTKTARVHRSGT